MKKIYVILAIIGFILVILFGLKFLCLEPEETDAEKFSEEYSLVDKENVFVYRDIDEIIKIMENGTGIVYLGFPECPWCKFYVKYLNEVAKEVGIEKIYYFNIFEDRDNETEKYKHIVSILNEYLQYDEEGNKKLFVPNVSFHIDGKIIGNDYETSLDTNGYKNPKDYWTDEKVNNLKSKIKVYMEQIENDLGICTDCNS